MAVVVYAALSVESLGAVTFASLVLVVGMVTAMHLVVKS